LTSARKNQQIDILQERETFPDVIDLGAERVSPARREK
jgi:hypothetical protein